MQSGSMQEFWDERYRKRSHVWSGEPNRQLVAVAESLQPGRALDVGAGEGADAIWLATSGWDVLGVDVSAVALSRARAHTRELDASVTARLDWRQVDLLSSPELPADFDLVSVQFMHLADPERTRLFRMLATRVGTGGSLLIVAHDPSDLHTGVGRPPQPELYYTPEQVAAVLDDSWDIRVGESRARTERTPDGRDVGVNDVVVHAVRLR
ncbi:class I SAM-dependent methyltransferase [Arthrobacter echini]|uniref:Class I SAM-dependent methyltransferase n=1 Tax=Arthrobacter echini TaxID=1529066 RepID=A0A4S5E4R2_9MICC|nr:class I SAM-dependent methyltransferase [Arthrobacter echini]THJ66474.1 class I SAM-dependent methyltransferase [Arthrobacter echini]